MLAVWIVVGVVVLAVLWTVYSYNRLVRLRVNVDNAWSQIDVQLRRRYDLIPNLIESVKGYAAHEREVFEDVTKARAARDDECKVRLCFLRMGSGGARRSGLRLHGGNRIRAKPR